MPLLALLYVHVAYSLRVKRVIALCIWTAILSVSPDKVNIMFYTVVVKSLVECYVLVKANAAFNSAWIVPGSAVFANTIATCKAT